MLVSARESKVVELLDVIALTSLRQATRVLARLDAMPTPVRVTVSRNNGYWWIHKYKV
jgi:hypothetical protein